MSETFLDPLFTQLEDLGRNSGNVLNDLTDEQLERLRRLALAVAAAANGVLLCTPRTAQQRGVLSEWPDEGYDAWRREQEGGEG